MDSPGQSDLLSVIIPAYNEVESLRAFITELVTALNQLVNRETPLLGVVRTEIIIVDDGSTDGTLQLAQELAVEFGQSNETDNAEGNDAGSEGCASTDREHFAGAITVVQLRRNFGKSAAMSAGFNVAQGNLIVTFDADGQDVPAELPRVLQKMADDQLDLVCGWRQSRIDRPVKKTTSRIYNKVTSTGTGLELHDFNTGLKLMTRQLVQEVPLYGEFHRFIPVLAHDLGFQVGEVAVEHRPRVAGKSKYLSVLRFPKTLLDLFSVMFLTRFSHSPMYFYGGIGMVLGGIGFTLGLYLTAIKVFWGEGIGQRPLLFLSVLLIVVGIQLLATGLLGETLRHAQAQQRTPFRIRSTTQVQKKS